MKKIATLLLAAGLLFSAAGMAQAIDFKIRGQWRVRRADFERWMTDKASNRAKSDEDEA